MIDRERIKEICTKLKPIIGKRADALWLAYSTSETMQARLDAEATIEMFAARHLGRDVNNKSILLPPPNPQASAGEFPLGTIYYGDHPSHTLSLSRENFLKHIGIFAITGAGKTNVGQNLLLGLLDKDIPFLVIDWKRSYSRLCNLNRPGADGIKVYSVGRKTDTPFVWNPLRPPPGVHPRTWVSVIAEVLEKSHISGPGVADILLDILDKKFEEYGFYDKTWEKYPNFYDAREELERVKFRGRRMLWQDSCSRILRTFTFGPAARAFNARNPVKIEELLERPVIIELDMELPKPLRVFFSDIILRWIHLYRLGQGETDKLRHVTLLEEVHNLFPRTNIEKQATNSLESVFREIRSFGEGLVNITQHPSLLPVYILGNCNTQVYLALQHEDDIHTAKRALFLARDEEVFLDRLKVGEGIVKIKGRVDPCYVKFPLAPASEQDVKNGGADD